MATATTSAEETGGREAVRVAVGVGSNLGDRLSRLTEAAGALEELLEGLRCSPVYRTRPVGDTDQPDFLNLCCVGRTRLSARDLLDELMAAERRAGRERPAPKGAPRVLDLDLLLYDGVTVEEPGLTVPHPEMERRAFVLVPLARIAPGWRHPGTGRTVAEMADGIDRGGVEPYRGDLPPTLRACVERDEPEELG